MHKNVFRKPKMANDKPGSLAKQIPLQLQIMKVEKEEQLFLKKKKKKKKNNNNPKEQNCW